MNKYLKYILIKIKYFRGTGIILRYSNRFSKIKAVLWKTETLRLLKNTKGYLTKVLIPKYLEKILFMINHDFDTLEELSKYCEYFSPKNTEFERPGENIPEEV